MDVIKQPYNVSSVADIAAQTALKYEHKIKTEQVDKIMYVLVALNRANPTCSAERDNLYKMLSKYSWLSPVPNSQANFILCRVVNRPAWLVASSLREKGILIRYYSTKHLVQFVRFVPFFSSRNNIYRLSKLLHSFNSSSTCCLFCGIFLSPTSHVIQLDYHSVRQLVHCSSSHYS